MSNWNDLKSAISNSIKSNNNQEITGKILQNTLLSIVSNIGENYSFAGVATVSTSPGNYSGPVFYLACEPGIYSNFNSIKINPGELCVLQNTEDSSWQKNVISKNNIVTRISADSYSSFNEKLNSFIIQSTIDQGLFVVSIGGVENLGYILYSGKNSDGTPHIMQGLIGSLRVNDDNVIIQASNVFNVLYREYINGIWQNWFSYIDSFSLINSEIGNLWGDTVYEDDTKWPFDGFIRANNGELAALDPKYNYKSTDYISVQEGQKISYTQKLSSYDLAAIACYDKDKKYIASKSKIPEANISYAKSYKYELTIDSEIKYIRASAWTSQNDNHILTATTKKISIADQLTLLKQTDTTLATAISTNKTEVNNSLSSINKSITDINTRIDNIGTGGGSRGSTAVNLTYITPEDYGAKGDLSTDDTTALNSCFTSAASKGLAVRALKHYLVSSPIKIVGSKLDVEINEIKSTSTSEPAVIYDGANGNIKIDLITTNYIGLELQTTTNSKCIENRFSIGKIDALHCIVFHLTRGQAFNNIFHFNVLSGKHKNWNGTVISNPNSYGITDQLYGDMPAGSYLSENSYYGGMIYNFSWAFYGTGNNNKFYNWGFENQFGGGWNFVNEFYCQIYADRHTEVVKDNDGAKLIKLTATTKDSQGRYYITHGSGNSEGLYYKSTQVLYPDNIDLSEAPIYSKVEGNKVLYLTNSSQSTIDCRMQANLVKEGSYSHLTNKFFIFGNKLILTPSLMVWKEVDSSTLDLRNLTKSSKKLPTTFEIKANTSIYLHDSYCFFGYSDFDVIQRDTFKAKVYNSEGNLIWDGSSKSAGTYHFAHRAYGETNYNVFLNGYGAKWFVNNELQNLSWYPTTGEITT